jgi:hypothetical protein
VNPHIEASVRDAIVDFAKGTEEDLAAFPDAQHPILDNHGLMVDHIWAPMAKSVGWRRQRL